mmetsp:Transcript_21626/g.54868  ORF Transcript_21626/g.54868 Transcript_21626/m.54868 type:complete len:208 (-) Transcript_21626:744-1367(-)
MRCAVVDLGFCRVSMPPPFPPFSEVAGTLATLGRMPNLASVSKVGATPRAISASTRSVSCLLSAPAGNFVRSSSSEAFKTFEDAPPPTFELFSTPSFKATGSSSLASVSTERSRLSEPPDCRGALCCTKRLKNWRSCASSESALPAGAGGSKSPKALSSSSHSGASTLSASTLTTTSRPAARSAPPMEMAAAMESARTAGLATASAG